MTASDLDGLTVEQQDQAVALVAAWIGPRMGYDGPAPIGAQFARNASGIQLIRDWDWPGHPTPTVILEGGPEDWAIYASADPRLGRQLERIRVFAEPYAGYALCLYPYPEWGFPVGGDIG